MHIIAITSAVISRSDFITCFAGKRAACRPNRGVETSSRLSNNLDNCCKMIFQSVQSDLFTTVQKIDAITGTLVKAGGLDNSV